MNCTRIIVAAVATATLVFTASIVLADEGAEQPNANRPAQAEKPATPPAPPANVDSRREATPAPAKDSADPKKPAEVQKNKTRSNQSND